MGKELMKVDMLESTLGNHYPGGVFKTSNSKFGYLLYELYEAQ